MHPFVADLLVSPLSRAQIAMEQTFRFFFVMVVVRVHSVISSSVSEPDMLAVVDCPATLNVYYSKCAVNTQRIISSTAVTPSPHRMLFVRCVFFVICGSFVFFHQHKFVFVEFATIFLFSYTQF